MIVGQDVLHVPVAVEVQARRVFPVEEDRAFRRIVQPHQNVEEGGFAGAREAKHTEGLPSTELKAQVDDLTAQMERHRDQPWAVTDAPASFVDRMVGQIVGVDLEVTSIEGKLKLGQNRPAADRASLAAGLAAELPDVAGRLAGLPGMPAD